MSLAAYATDWWYGVSEWVSLPTQGEQERKEEEWEEDEDDDDDEGNDAAQSDLVRICLNLAYMNEQTAREFKFNKNDMKNALSGLKPNQINWVITGAWLSAHYLKPTSLEAS